MSVLASFTNLGGPDLIIILVIILVLFGAKKLPELARGLGQAMREFQKAKDEFGNELHKADQANTPAGKQNAQGAQSTVPRIENSSAGSTPQPDAGQTTSPGGTTGQA
jgi:sec-independent protein translocase protein TatA